MPAASFVGGVVTLRSAPWPTGLVDDLDCQGSASIPFGQFYFPRSASVRVSNVFFAGLQLGGVVLAVALSFGLEHVELVRSIQAGEL